MWCQVARLVTILVVWRSGGVQAGYVKFPGPTVGSNPSRHLWRLQQSDRLARLADLTGLGQSAVLQADPHRDLSRLNEENIYSPFSIQDNSDALREDYGNGHLGSPLNSEEEEEADGYDVDYIAVAGPPVSHLGRGANSRSRPDLEVTGQGWPPGESLGPVRSGRLLRGGDWPPATEFAKFQDVRTDQLASPPAPPAGFPSDFTQDVDRAQNFDVSQFHPDLSQYVQENVPVAVANEFQSEGPLSSFVDTASKVVYAIQLDESLLDLLLSNRLIVDSYQKRDSERRETDSDSLRRVLRLQLVKERGIPEVEDVVTLVDSNWEEGALTSLVHIEKAGEEELIGPRSPSTGTTSNLQDHISPVVPPEIEEMEQRESAPEANEILQGHENELNLVETHEENTLQEAPAVKVETLSNVPVIKVEKFPRTPDEIQKLLEELDAAGVRFRQGRGPVLEVPVPPADVPEPPLDVQMYLDHIQPRRYEDAQVMTLGTEPAGENDVFSVAVLLNAAGVETHGETQGYSPLNKSLHVEEGSSATDLTGLETSENSDLAESITLKLPDLAPAASHIDLELSASEEEFDLAGSESQKVETVLSMDKTNSIEEGITHPPKLQLELVPPSINSSGDNVSHLVGGVAQCPRLQHNATLHCRIRSLSPDSIVQRFWWLRQNSLGVGSSREHKNFSSAEILAVNGQAINGRIRLHEPERGHQRLVLLDVRQEDAGVYVCQAGWDDVAQEVSFVMDLCS